MGKLAVGFVALAEFLFGGVFVLYAILACFPVRQAQWATALLCVIIAAVLIVLGARFIRGDRWAYRFSWLIGVLTLWLGGAGVWEAMRPESPFYRQEGLALTTGVFLVLMSILGLTALAMPETRRELSYKRA